MKKQFLVIILCVVFLKIDSQELARFKDGDNVALIGDSITHGGTYQAFLQFFYATQFPNITVNYFNGGISGDNCNGTLFRLEKDILTHNPDHAIIMLGMNDVGRHLYPVDQSKVTEETLKQRENTLQTYIKNMTELATKLQDKGIDMIFMTPSIYDQTGDLETPNYFGVNDGLVTFSNVVKDLGKQFDAPVVDLNRVMLSINKTLQDNNKSATIIGNDRTHPGLPGHLVMAYEIIKTLFPIEYSSYIEVNAKDQTVDSLKNCEVTLTNGINEFEVLEKSLPFSVKKSLHSTLLLIEDSEELTQQILKVKKLKKGHYNLFIDDDLIGVYSYKDLSNGINLSLNENTPQYKQAQNVYDLCFEYNKIGSELRTVPLTDYRTLRDYKGPNTLEAKRKALFEKAESQKDKPWYGYAKKMARKYFEVLPKQDSLWGALNKVRKEIYSNNRPVKHVYRLVKI